MCEQCGVPSAGDDPGEGLREMFLISDCSIFSTPG